MSRVLATAGRLGPTLAVGLALSLFIGIVRAQAPAMLPLPAMPPEEAAAITAGWVMLAQGKVREAADYAESLLARLPRSPAALTLAVESAIAGRGAYSSLDTYERWLGSRTTEEPSVLDRIVRATLYEWSRQTADVTARIQALKALAEDGVPEAVAVLTAGAQSGGVAEARALVSLGNAEAIDRALARLKTAEGPRSIEIMTLGESRSPRAVRPLIELLKAERASDRAEAATALGKIGQRDTVPQLTPLLNDPNGGVRLAAAGALLKLGDPSGVAMIRELAASEYSAVRRTAAVLLEPLADEEWKALVRGLASDPDPSFRLDAARLLAPFDAAFSKSVLEGLLADPNPEIRDQAGVIMAHDTATLDTAMLRRLLRAGSGRVRVAAATRLLISLH
jgi:HEAT repeat protein